MCIITDELFPCNVIVACALALRTGFSQNPLLRSKTNMH